MATLTTTSTTTMSTMAPGGSIDRSNRRRPPTPTLSLSLSLSLSLVDRSATVYRLVSLDSMFSFATISLSLSLSLEFGGAICWIFFQKNIFFDFYDGRSTALRLDVVVVVVVVVVVDLASIFGCFFCVFRRIVIGTGSIDRRLSSTTPSTSTIDPADPVADRADSTDCTLSLSLSLSFFFTLHNSLCGSSGFYWVFIGLSIGSYWVSSSSLLLLLLFLLLLLLLLLGPTGS